MSTSSKSVREILRVAIKVGRESLPDYSHKKSKKKYTQAQLFACLVLRSYLKLDYRGTASFLSDFKEAREDLGIEQSPHFSSLHKASNRLLKQKNVLVLLEKTLREFSLKKRV